MARRQFKVVLADNSGLDQQIEETFLQRSGFKVLTAKDGKAALELAAFELPDLVILDYSLPILSGTEVCESLKAAEETQQILVVINTDQDTEDIRNACLIAGVDALVPRSAGRERLLEVVSEMLQVSPRRPVRMTVLLSMDSEKGEKESLGRAINLSECGIRIEVNRTYDVESPVRVRFMLPGEPRKFQAAARVRWINKQSKETYAMGLEFTEVPAVDRRILNGFIDKSFSES